MCIVMMTPVRMLHAGLFAGRKGGCLSEMVDDARLAILCFLLAVHGSLACSGKWILHLSTSPGLGLLCSAQ